MHQEGHVDAPRRRPATVETLAFRRERKEGARGCRQTPPMLEPDTVMTESLTKEAGLLPVPLDGWLVPPHTASRRSRSCGGDRKGTVMTRPLVELVEQFCQYQLKQRGKTEGGVEAYRWNLEQFLIFTRARFGRVGRISDLARTVLQEGWMIWLRGI